MKGTKYLSELVNVNLLQQDKLNVIYAPTGSGKTYFALTHIPKLVYNAFHSVVYLIDTINGKEQILRNGKAVSDNYIWAKEVDEKGLWFEQDDRIVVMTYAKFGYLALKYPGFYNCFDYIICDELPSLLKFQNYSTKPNSHSVALQILKAALDNEKTTVIALSATPDTLKKEFKRWYYEVPIDREDILRFDVERCLPYSSIDFVLSLVKPTEIGLCYIYRVTDMLKTEETAKKYGLSPICIWSIKNTEQTMTAKQLEARESILNNFMIPDAYNFLIINASSETSLKIKSRVDYAIINSDNRDTQIQVRGRINNDLKCLYLPTTMKNLPEVPDEFLGVRLFVEEKTKLYEFLNLKNKDGSLYKWPSVKTILIENDYYVAEGRENNRRYAVITKGP